MIWEDLPALPLEVSVTLGNKPIFSKLDLLVLAVVQLLWIYGGRIRTETCSQKHTTESMNLGCGLRGTGSCGGVKRMKACCIPKTERV